MTKQEIIKLQIKLNEAGYGPLVVDGKYGTKTEEVYRKYLDELDPKVPTVIPPPKKPWWTSKAVLGSLATIIASILGVVGYSIDASMISEILVASVTAITGILSLIGTINRKGEIEKESFVPFKKKTTVEAELIEAAKQYKDPRGLFSGD